MPFGEDQGMITINDVSEFDSLFNQQFGNFDDMTFSSFDNDHHQGSQVHPDPASMNNTTGTSSGENASTKPATITDNSSGVTNPSGTINSGNHDSSDISNASSSTNAPSVSHLDADSGYTWDHPWVQAMLRDINGDTAPLPQPSAESTHLPSPPSEPRVIATPRSKLQVGNGSPSKNDPKSVKNVFAKVHNRQSAPANAPANLETARTTLKRKELVPMENSTTKKPRTVAPLATEVHAMQAKPQVQAQMIAHQPILRHEQPIPRHKQPIRRNEQPISHHEQPIPRHEQSYRRNEQPILHNEPPILRNEQERLPKPKTIRERRMATTAARPAMTHAMQAPSAPSMSQATGQKTTTATLQSIIQDIEFKKPNYTIVTHHGRAFAVMPLPLNEEQVFQLEQERLRHKHEKAQALRRRQQMEQEKRVYQHGRHCAYSSQ